jgi:hypothetical protein
MRIYTKAEQRAWNIYFAEVVSVIEVLFHGLASAGVDKETVTKLTLRFAVSVLVVGEFDSKQALEDDVRSKLHELWLSVESSEKEFARTITENGWLRPLDYAVYEELEDGKLRISTLHLA